MHLENQSELIWTLVWLNENDMWGNKTVGSWPGSVRTSLADAMSINLFSASFFSASDWKLSGCHCCASFLYALMISCLLALLSQSRVKKSYFFSKVTHFERDVSREEVNSASNKSGKHKNKKKLPADTEDLVVVPLTRDFEQLLCAFQPFSNVIAVTVKLSGLLVILHSCKKRKKTKTSLLALNHQSSTFMPDVHKSLQSPWA